MVQTILNNQLYIKLILLRHILSLHCRSQKTGAFQDECGMFLDHHGLSKQGQMAGQTLGFCKHPRTTQNKKRQVSNDHLHTVQTVLTKSVSNIQ